MSPRAQRLLHDALVASTDRSPGKVAVLADGAAYSYEALLDAALRSPVRCRTTALGAAIG